jgi:hypothetical protein
VSRRRLAAVVAAGVLSAPGVAVAQPAAPQPGTPCPPDADGALTKVATSVLQCVGGSWRPFTDVYPSSDRWLSYGPAVALHGQGMRNPEILSGPWTARPLTADATCRAEQAAVVSAGEVGPPQMSIGEPGRPLRFEVLPVVFSISLSGACVWERDR